MGADFAVASNQYIEHDERGAMVSGNWRGYAVKLEPDLKQNQIVSFDRLSVLPMNMLGQTLRLEVDMKGVPCGCNAAVYYVGMSAQQNRNPLIGYCDAQVYYPNKPKKCSCPQCAEEDVIEANVIAMQSTLHMQTNNHSSKAAAVHATHCYPQSGTKVMDPVTDTPFTNCDQYGIAACANPVGDNSNRTYGPDATSVINTHEPYEVVASWDAHGHKFVGLTQGEARKLLIWDYPGYAAHWREDWCTPWSDMKGFNPVCTQLLHSAMSEHMTLVFSLWGEDSASSSNMCWLSGNGCAGCNPEDATFVIKRVSVEDGFTHFDSPHTGSCARDPQCPASPVDPDCA